MSFCHHLVSVVCHPFTFHILIFSENPQPNELKLGKKNLWKVLTKECTFCYDPLPNMAATGNSCFWLADLKKSSPLKPLGQMNRNLVGSIYGRSSLKSAHFVMIHYQTWPLQAILVSDWPIFKNLLLWNRLAKWTETRWEESMEGPLWRLLISSWSVSKHGYHRNLVGIIYGMSSYEVCSFRPNRLANMAITCNSCFWLVDF
jgi:hypothetical protein